MLNFESNDLIGNSDTNFWSEVDKQFFDFTPFNQKFLDYILKCTNRHEITHVNPLYSSYQQYLRVKEILKDNSKSISRKKIPLMNTQNIKKYLYINEMINGSNNQEICDKLKQIHEIIQNSSSLPKRLQIRALQQEEKCLDEIIRGLNESVELSEIQEVLTVLGKEFKAIQTVNSAMVQKQILQWKKYQKRLKTESQNEMKNRQTVHYTICKEQNMIKLRKQTILSEQQKLEIEMLRRLIADLQEQQIADSILSIQYNEAQNSSFLVQFDNCITDQKVTVDIDKVYELQRRRDQKKEIKQAERIRTEQDSQNYLCHFCLEVKQINNMKRCKYNSAQGQLVYSGDFGFFNCDGVHNEELINDYNVQNYSINKEGFLVCKRYFCNRCLKCEFPKDEKEKEKDKWMCPLCQGICNCPRCCRSEVIQKLKKMYIELGGQLNDLKDISFFEQIVENKKSQYNSGIQQLSTTKFLLKNLNKIKKDKKEVKKVHESIIQQNISSNGRDIPSSQGREATDVVISEARVACGTSSSEIYSGY